MNHLRQDISYAIRTCLKAPGFTATAVLVLAIGIGANTAMFTMVNELLLRPLWGKGGELVGVYSRDRTVPDSYRMFSYPNYADIREAGAFQSLLAQTMTMVGTPAGDDTRQVLATLVSSNYFEALGVTLAAGRAFTPEEERPGIQQPVAIVPYGTWLRAGTDPAFLGTTIRINADEYTVVGVAPPGFIGTVALLTPAVYLPLGVFDRTVSDRFKNNGRGLLDRSNAGLLLAGRVTPGLHDTAVQARLDALAAQLEAAYPADNRHYDLSSGPLPRLSLSPQPTTNTALTAFTGFLMTLSGIVLVIACLNIANMLLARGTARKRELAVRLALGAGRARIVRQLMTESLLLSAAGAALGLVFSYWAIRAFAASLEGALPFSIALDGGPNLAVLIATVGFAAIGTIAFGLGPALGLSRRDLIADLRDRGGEGAGTRRRFSARNVMVVAQVALSLALLTAGGVFARTTIVAAAGRPGYGYDRLILASVDARLAGLDASQGAVAYGDVLARVRSSPGITAATLASTIPFGDAQEGRSIEHVAAEGREPVRARTFRAIGADYFKMLGLSLVRGRDFTAAEESSAGAPRVAIIDDALARQLFGGADPIGQMIRVARDAGQADAPAGEPMEIIGIAPPLREELLDRAPVPHVYVPFASHYRASMWVQARIALGADEIAATQALRRDILAVNRQVAITRATTMQAFHDSSTELWALNTSSVAFSGLGIVAMLLAALGVYGVRAYIVEQRTREIGIRMALGATPRNVLNLVITDGSWLTAAGLAVGLPLAVFASIAMRSVFVDVGGIDVVVLIVSTVVLTTTATLAAAIPAHRATRVQPLTALRAD